MLAAKDLPLKQDQLGSARPSRGAALALRAKVLLFAASPLANGKAGSLVSELVDDQGRQLLSGTYDESKWARAAAAARDVMEMGVYDLYTAGGVRTDSVSGYLLQSHLLSLQKIRSLLIRTGRMAGKISIRSNHTVLYSMVQFRFMVISNLFLHEVRMSIWVWTVW